MIIDSHCHMWSKRLDPETYERMMQIGVTMSGGDIEKVRARLDPTMDDTGDLLVHDMDEAGIDKSILLGGEDERQIEIFSEAVKKHKGRLVFFAQVDPRKADAPKLLEKAVKQYGAKGLKVHPVMQEIYPNDPRCYRLYEKCIDLGIPVVIHTGEPEHVGSAKYCYPLHVEDVIDHFPELTITMAHAGEPFWEICGRICGFRRNAYVDIGYWQVYLLHRWKFQYYIMLRGLIDRAGADKVMFGTDFPALRQVRRLGGQLGAVNAVRKPPEGLEALGITFTQEEINAVLGGNAERLYKKYGWI